jgi:hypothetical protein
MQNFTKEKVAQKIKATSVIKNLLEANNRPLGEKSPNLVTLITEKVQHREAIQTHSL